MLRSAFISLVAVASSIFAAQAQPVVPEFRINLTAGISWPPPVVSANQTGDYIVVWNNGVESFARIYSAEHSAFGSEITIPPSDSQWAAHPWSVCGVALGMDGTVVVTKKGLLVGDLQGSACSFRFLDTHGAPLGEERVVGGSTYDHCTKLAVVASDAFVLFYVSLNFNLAEDLVGDRYDRDGVWQSRAFKFEGVVEAHVSVNASGTLAVLYQEGGVERPLLARTVSDVNIAGPVHEVAVGRRRHSYIDDDGSFSCVWAAGEAVFVRHFTASGAAGQAFQFEDVRPSQVVAPEVEGFIVLGERLSESRNVTARRYDSTGSPRGPEFQVNVSSATDSHWERVVPLPDGSFVVVWVRAGNLYGRHFDATTAVESTAWSDLKSMYR